MRETLEFDGRAARTLRTLFLHPGRVTVEYLAGRRVRYTPPFRLYLVLSVVFFLTMSWSLQQGLFTDGAQKAGTLDRQLSFVGDDLPKLVFLLLPGFAALLKIAFRQRLYFEHLIHALHLHSVGYILLAIMLPFEHAANQHWLFMTIQVLAFGWLLFYIGLSVNRVYEAPWYTTLAKTTLILGSYVVLLSVAISIASSITGIPL
ncbi:MAG: DUF3667 domain-containing protein [Pseudomonadota bacterium]